MKTTFAILLLAITSLTISAQEPPATPKATEPSTPAVEKKEAVSNFDEPTAVCDLGIPNSPIVTGLQLRMSEVEASLKAHTPFEKDAADPAHRKRVSVKLNNDPFLVGVESATLTSVDERVSSIHLTYTQKWATAKEFVQDLAPKLGLVRGAFRIDRERNTASITCKEFTVDLKAGDPSEILLTETNAARKSANPPGQ